MEGEGGNYGRGRGKLWKGKGEILREGGQHVFNSFIFNQSRWKDFSRRAGAYTQHQKGGGQKVAKLPPPHTFFSLSNFLM